MKRTECALHKCTGYKDSRTVVVAAIIVMMYNSYVLYRMYIDIMKLLPYF
jgi:hypothetical protein